VEAVIDCSAMRRRYRLANEKLLRS